MLRYAFTNNREAGDVFHTAGWDDPSARGSSFTEDHDGAGIFDLGVHPASCRRLAVPGCGAARCGAHQ